MCVCVCVCDYTNLDVNISKMPKKIYNQRISYWNNSKKNIWLFKKEI